MRFVQARNEEPGQKVRCLPGTRYLVIGYTSTTYSLVPEFNVLLVGSGE
jgi:hypothetical protein